MFEEKIKEAIAKIIKLKKKDIEIKKPFGTAEKFGDYCFACFGIAKKKKKNPKKFAEEVVKKLQKLKIKEIAKIKAVGGYVNFFLNKDFLTKEIIKQILNEKEKYGSLNLKGKALIEHTSLNPNASPHVGNIRNAIIGDVLSRLLKFHGYKTETHFLVNDVGKQMALLILGSKGDETFDNLLNLYIVMSKEMQRKPEIEKQVFEILEKIEKLDKKTMSKLKKIVKIAVEGQKEILSKLGIFYDVFDFESTYIKKDSILLKQFEKTKRLKKDIEGRCVLDQSKTKYQFEKSMKSPMLVLTRSSGVGLYVLRDIAYTKDKLKTAPVNIVVLGEEQKLYFKQLSASLELLGYIPPRVVHYSFMLLKTKQGIKKMAKRKGEVILVSEFIKQAIRKAKEEIKKRDREKDINMNIVSEAIGIGSVKYSIAKVEQNKGIIFDWEEALNFEGNSAPYLQYTYVRALNIIKKLGRANIGKAKVEEAKIGEQIYKNVSQKEYNLVKKLGEFPKVVSETLDKLEIHLLCNYIYTLAQTFNDFYESCPVIKEKDTAIKTRKIMIVKTSLIILKIVLDLLGLSALDAM